MGGYGQQESPERALEHYGDYYNDWDLENLVEKFTVRFADIYTQRKIVSGIDCPRI